MRCLKTIVYVSVLAALLSACSTDGPALNETFDTMSLDVVDVWFLQDFSSGTQGWFDANSADPWYGSISYNHEVGTATFEGDADSAPFSRFDQYRNEWPGAYIAEIDVYLDPEWPEGQGFDYSVASSRADGTHLRDFIFHVGVVEGQLLVNGSNNADFHTNQYKLLNDNNGDYAVVTTAGWYTLQHVFQNDGSDVLEVKLNLLDTSGNIVWSATRSSPDDTITDVVGGNRYAWFTHIDVAGGIEVDNHTLYQVTTLNAPRNMDDCKDGLYAAFGFRNQGQCIASVQANVNSDH